MPYIEATHWICGTVVSAEVSDEYDLEEGVALACPNCQDVWWHYPLARGAAGETGVDATIAGRRLTPGKERGERKHPTLVTNWLGPALALCVIAIVLLRLADLGPRSIAAPPSRTGTTGATGASAVTGYITVVAPQYRIERPRAWIRFERNDAQVLAPSRQAPISVSVYADRRPELTLDQMTGLAQQLLETQLPGATVKGPVSVRLSGRDGRRITARSGPVLREMLVVSAGSFRYVVQVSARDGATREDRDRLSRIVRSFEATG